MARTPFHRDESGASLVETALVLPMFLAMLFGILQIGVFAMMVANFNNALVVASRQIRTGQAESLTAKSFMQLICSNMLTSDCMSRVNIQVQSGSTFGQFANAPAPDPQKPQTPQYDPGAAGSTVLVTATYTWPLIVPFTTSGFPQTRDGQVLITSRLLFKNEPYS